MKHLIYSEYELEENREAVRRMEQDHMDEQREELTKSCLQLICLTYVLCNSE